MSFGFISGSKITPHLTGQHVFTMTRAPSFLEQHGARIIQAAAIGAVLAYFLH